VKIPVTLPFPYSRLACKGVSPDDILKRHCFHEICQLRFKSEDEDIVSCIEEIKRLEL